MYSGIHIIGAACGHGGRDRRAAAGPETLKNAGLVARLEKHGIRANWPEIIESRPQQTGISGLDIVSELNRRLAGQISTLVSEQSRFAVLGGDHACAIGTWSGVYRALGDARRFGLIWVDAHMDSHTPATTPSGALHGMPLACLLGYGADELTSLAAPGPALLPQHVCLIGVRSYEQEEADLLAELGVHVCFMDDVNRLGMDAVMQQALRIARTDTAGFGISIDLDAIDPADAPAVASKVPGGLSASDLMAALKSAGDAPGLIGMEIAEFNPFLDVHDQTLRLIPGLLAAAMSGVDKA
ncbi:MAG: arginase [Mariprofundaceae bacterium]|nr:arginase [Mariprofundaceae bacterium]